jgi:hypothetical protein
MLVASPQTLSDSDLLIFLNDELPGVVALIKSAGEEYLMASSDVAYSSGATAVTIPSRAMAGGLRTVRRVDGTNLIPLNRIEPERSHEYTGGGTPSGFMLFGGSVVPLPVPDSSGTLRFSYVQRPGTVVLDEDAAQITAINTGTGVVTFTALPDTHVSGASFDFIGNATPNPTRAVDQASTAATTTTLTFASLPSTLAVGDWVAVAGESPFPGIPMELDTLLSQAVLCRWMSAAGLQNAGNEFKTLDRMKQDALKLLTPRTPGSFRPIISTSGPGWGRWR